MKTKQLVFKKEIGWKQVNDESNDINPVLILVFGSTALIKDSENLTIWRNKYPNAIFVGCSSSGEITGTTVNDDTLVATLVEFSHTTIKHTILPIEDSADSFEVGKKLVESLFEPDLQHLFVISEGLNINGSELVRGLRTTLPNNIAVTGGLAGDGALFSETYILNSNGIAQTKMVSAIGFYGNNLQVSFGSLGGWDSFGIERLVTKSAGNILYELDGVPALNLYKSFLGDYAANLPASGLLFPLNLRIANDNLPVVRTILAVDESTQSLTFAGDIPLGSYVRLMKANFDRLIEGAIGAAKGTLKNNPELAILISCVGRKLVLNQLIEEEVEGVSEVLGNQAQLCGFYSYGEISPFMANTQCELHNQTMTITTFKEL